MAKPRPPEYDELVGSGGFGEPADAEFFVGRDESAAQPEDWEQLISDENRIHVDGLAYTEQMHIVRKHLKGLNPEVPSLPPWFSDTRLADLRRERREQELGNYTSAVVRFLPRLEATEPPGRWVIVPAEGIAAAKIRKDLTQARETMATFDERRLGICLDTVHDYVTLANRYSATGSDFLSCAPGYIPDSPVEIPDFRHLNYLLETMPTYIRPDRYLCTSDRDSGVLVFDGTRGNFESMYIGTCYTKLVFPIREVGRDLPHTSAFKIPTVHQRSFEEAA